MKETKDTSRDDMIYRRVQRYHVRANFAGSLTWVCPYCGHVNRTTLFRTAYYVRCTGSIRDTGKPYGCNAKLIPKLSLAALPSGGRHTTPPDYVIPDSKGSNMISEALPLGDLDRWRQGGCVHDYLSGQSAESFVREVLVRAAGGRPVGEVFNEVKTEMGL